MKRTLITAIFCLALSVAMAQIDRSKQPEPGPAPEISLEEAQKFELNNGLTVLVVENHKLPRVRVQLNIDNPPILEGDKAGVQSLTGALMGNGSTNITKDSFNEEVDFLGATINIGAQSAFASSLSKYFPRVLELMADAAINPNFTQEEFDKEKDKLITNLKSQEKDIGAISSRVQEALAFGKDHPKGEFITESTLNQVTLADVEQFYRDYFVPANAYLIVIGDIAFDSVKELVTTHFTPWTKATPPSLTYSEPMQAQYTQINFTDVPNAIQSNVTLQSLVNLKEKDDDYLAAVFANYILGGASVSRLEQNIREKKGYAYYSRSGLGNDKYGQSRFRAVTEVRNAVTDSVIVELLNEIDNIINNPVTDEELQIAKANYVGSFVRRLENPETVANYALNIEIEDLPSDYYKTYLERVEALTVDDIKQAAKKYFTASNARIVVAGKGSEVLENLEKVQFKGKKVPVLYYDKYGTKTTKPVYTVAMPDGVTAKTILEKYIIAIGGKAKLDGVESWSMVAEANVQGNVLEIEQKKTTKNQSLQNVKFAGNTMQKQVLDGDSGYAIVQGQRKDFTEEELAKIKEESAPFPELNYLVAGGVSIEGIEQVGDKKAYKLKITADKTAFYDVETGLKLQEMTTQEVQGQKIVGTTGFDNYKEVSGILFPFAISQTNGPQKFDFIVKEVKVNEGVSAADFK